LRLHRLLMVTPTTRRSGWGLPNRGEHGVAARRQMSASDRPPLFGSWRKAYAFTLCAFAVEVALLYAFTLRFS
ncbi:MAG: hypothetical protein M3Z64_04125, partial [Verrucomicrobiota bacterium]|nr:hypothetical protein [Verrucomicrobiota bacterium]